MTIFSYLTRLSIFKLLQENSSKKIISIDINNITQINKIVKFIYFNDILVGFDNIISHVYFQKIINHNYKKKIILFVNNIYNQKLINKISLINSNIIFYSFNHKIYHILKKILIKRRLYFIPASISHLANYFNYKKNKNKNNLNATIFYYEKNYFNKIKNLASEYFSNIKYINLKNKFLNIRYLIGIIKENELILTDSIYITELSALYYTSCILYKNSHIKKYNLIFNLNYIKIINNIKTLKKLLIILKNTTNKYKLKIYDKKVNLILKEFK